jgi:hypothetical protein
MDTKDKQSKSGGATASKTAASKKQVGGESPSPGQGATSSQNQGGTQNQGATGNQGAGITPQQNQGMVGAQHDTTSQQKQQNQESQQGSQQGGDGQDLMQDAKQTASEVVNQVQQRAGDQINRQKETAASELSTVVNAVRRFGETLNNEGNGPIARFAAQYGDKAANGLDRFAKYLREQDPKRLLDDVQKFGRRQPALLIGGAFLLGFAGARVIKSSMESASGSSTNTRGQSWSNTSAQPAKDIRGDTGAGQQPFNTGVSEPQSSTSPNRI